MAGSAPLKHKLRPKFKAGIRKNADLVDSQVIKTVPAPGSEDMNAQMGNMGSVGLPNDVKRISPN